MINTLFSIFFVIWGNCPDARRLSLKQCDSSLCRRFFCEMSNGCLCGPNTERISSKFLINLLNELLLSLAESPSYTRPHTHTHTHRHSHTCTYSHPTSLTLCPSPHIRFVTQKIIKTSKHDRWIAKIYFLLLPRLKKELFVFSCEQ